MKRKSPGSPEVVIKTEKTTGRPFQEEMPRSIQGEVQTTQGNQKLDGDSPISPGYPNIVNRTGLIPEVGVASRGGERGMSIPATNLADQDVAVDEQQLFQEQGSLNVPSSELEQFVDRLIEKLVKRWNC